MKRITHALRHAASKKTNARATHCGIHCRLRTKSKKLYDITPGFDGILRAVSPKNNIQHVTCERCQKVLGTLKGFAPIQPRPPIQPQRWGGAIGTMRLDALAEFDQMA